MLTEGVWNPPFMSYWPGRRAVARGLPPSFAYHTAESDEAISTALPRGLTLVMLATAGLWLHQHTVGITAFGLPAMVLCLVGLAWSQHKGADPNAQKTGIEVAARTFAELLESHGFDPALALATCCYFDENTGGAFPIQPDDDLEDHLGLNPEEVEHTLLALSALLGRKPALHWQRPLMETVEDLIAVLQAAQPELGQNTRAAA